MKIHEVCKALGITKKAIAYYENQGLISIKRDERGYRVFSQKNLDRLREIILFRKLEVPTSNIKKFIRSTKLSEDLKEYQEVHQNQLRSMVKKQYYLDKLIGSANDSQAIEGLLREIRLGDEEDINFICVRLKEYFPGGLGQALASHFKNFKFDKIISREQNQAWLDLVDYLDNRVKFNLSPMVMSLMEDLDYDHLSRIQDRMKADILNDQLTREDLDDMEEVTQAMYESLRDDHRDIYDNLRAYQEQIKAFFTSSDYYSGVIEPMMVLSEEYRTYYHKMKALQ